MCQSYLNKEGKEKKKEKIMASSLITLWQIDGETMGTMRDFIFLGFKITADCDCSHEIKRRLLFGREVMTNLDCILKNRDKTFTDKDPYCHLYGFSSSHTDVRVGP